MNDSFILSRVGYWKLEAGYTQRFETWVQLFDTFERLLLPLGIGTKIVQFDDIYLLSRKTDDISQKH